MRKFISVAGPVLLAATTLGCTGSRGESEPIAATSARLVGGTPDTGDPAVVLFQATGADGGECTAEFISTTVLVTAAHCVLTEAGKPLTGAGFRIYQGNDFSNAAEEDWIDIDPSNVHAHPSFQGDDHDVAVLVLSEPALVTPLALGTRALSPSDVGKSVRLVGYGSNVVAPTGGDDGFGLKRQLTTTIASVETSFVEVGKSGQTACDGDSGGPALLAIGGVETIVGLDSYSDADIDCSEGEFYQRVDTETEFIAEFMTPSDGAGGGAGGDDAAGTTTTGASSGGPKDASDSETSASCAIPASRHPSSAPTWVLTVVLGLGFARWRARRRGTFKVQEQGRR